MEVDKQRIAELVGKIQSGDNSAFEELYKLTSQRAYFVALEFVKNESDAEDILQESYIKALSKINELDKPESFSSWLNQIVANKSKDFLKKKKPTLFEAEENEVFEVIPDEDKEFMPEENLDQTELQKTVMEVLDELSEEKRACVLMMYFEELSVGEIAETLEIPEGTVKTRLFSARKDLKDKFAKRGITSLYSAAPIGVIIWALRGMSDAVSKTFVAGGTSAKVLAGITAAGSGAAAAGAGTTAAVAGTAASTAAATTAAGTGAAAGGAGMVAKIAALTVAQKIVAGVSVAAVVAGSAAGVATVVNNRSESETTTSTEIVEEVTTAPRFESTTLLDVMAEITESAEAETTGAQTTTARTTEKATIKAEVSAEITQSATQTATPTELETTTKAKATRPTTTRRDYSLYTSATTTSTTALSTTVEATTTKRTTTEAETTTKAAETTATVNTTTTEATTAAQAKITVNYTISDYDGPQPDPYVVYLSPGESMSAVELQQKMTSELGLTFISFYETEFPEPAEAGKEYVITGMAII